VRPGRANPVPPGKGGVQGRHWHFVALDSRFGGNDGGVACHARRILGSTNDCSRSTTRLVVTKTSDSTRIVPCRTGTSRLMIALLSKNPLPGQVNTVSTNIEPPSR